MNAAPFHKPLERLNNSASIVLGQRNRSITVAAAACSPDHPTAGEVKRLPQCHLVQERQQLHVPGDEPLWHVGAPRPAERRIKANAADRETRRARSACRAASRCQVAAGCEWHCARRALSRAACTPGNTSATSVPMIATTTSSSTSVIRPHGEFRRMAYVCGKAQRQPRNPAANAVRRFGKSHARGGRPSRPIRMPRVGRSSDSRAAAKRPSHSPRRINGHQQNASRIVLGHSGGAVPDSHRVPCLSAAENQAADHQRTL